MSLPPNGSPELSLADAVQIALREATRGELAKLEFEYPLDPGRRLDLRMRLIVEGEPVDFAIELVGQAYPRDVARAIDLVKRLQPDGDVPVIPLVAAEELSPGAKELLRQEDIAYFDRRGTLYLRWRHWIINIREVEAKATSKPKHGAMNLFTGARAGVVLAMLHSRREWMQVTELAAVAQTTGFTCSTVLQELEHREWCESEGTGRARRRRLIRPNALLDAWAQAWPPKKEKRSHWYCFAPPAPDGVQQRLSRSLQKSSPSFPWAFTGTPPANAYAPLLTAVGDAEIIVPPGHAARLGERLGLEPADKGFNVTIIERDTSSLLFRQDDADGLWAASPFILYLDLLNGRGRNKELAANVRAKMELGSDGLGN
jgi:hypothetical protein